MSIVSFVDDHFGLVETLRKQIYALRIVGFSGMYQLLSMVFLATCGSMKGPSFAYIILGAILACT